MCSVPDETLSGVDTNEVISQIAKKKGRSRVLSFLFCHSLPAMQDRRERLIDQHADQGIQQALDQSEGHIEDDQALDKAVCRGQDRLIHAQDGFQRHVVELDVGRVGDEVVGRYTEQGHGHGTGHGTDDGVLAALVVLVEVTGQCREHRTQHEVAQLTHQRGRGTLDDHMEQVLHKADDHTVHRAKGKGTQQSGQVGEVHLDEGRDEHRERELDEHQDKGHRAEHGGNGQVAGRVFLHGNIPPGAFWPQIKDWKAPFAWFRNREDNQKRALPQQTLQQGA